MASARAPHAPEPPPPPSAAPPLPHAGALVAGPLTCGGLAGALPEGDEGEALSKVQMVHRFIAVRPHPRPWASHGIAITSPTDAGRPTPSLVFPGVCRGVGPGAPCPRGMCGGRRGLVSGGAPDQGPGRTMWAHQTSRHTNIWRDGPGLWYVFPIFSESFLFGGVSLRRSDAAPVVIAAAVYTSAALSTNSGPENRNPEHQTPETAQSPQSKPVQGRCPPKVRGTCPVPTPAQHST